MLLIDLEIRTSARSAILYNQGKLTTTEVYEYVIDSWRGSALL